MKILAKHAPFAHPARNVNAFPIEEGDIVADFGAGSGAYTFEIAKLLGKSGKVYAIDVQQELLRRIRNDAHRRGFTNVETIWGDISRHAGSKLGNGAVDVALMSNVLFQLEHQKGAFEEARRILKLDGKLIVIDWTASFRGLGPTKKHVFSKDQALELAQESGFALIEQFAAGAHHYGLIFQKESQASRTRSL